MPSVENLAGENRILRNRFRAALDARKSPINGILWPLVYLGVKILRHEEAVEGLAERRFGNEAGIILRVILEAAINIMWLMKSEKSEDIIENLKRYMSYQAVASQKYRDYMRESELIGSMPKHLKKEIFHELDTMDEQTLKIQSEYDFDRYKLWSGKTIKQMAIEIGWKDHYDTMYQTYSDIIHSGITAMPEYLVFDDKGKITVNHRSQEDHCKACLIMGKNYMVAAFSFLDVILNLGLEDLVDNNLPNKPPKIDLDKL